MAPREHENSWLERDCKRSRIPTVSGSGSLREYSNGIVNERTLGTHISDGERMKAKTQNRFGSKGDNQTQNVEARGPLRP
jgi:hypothetical protein